MSRTSASPSRLSPVALLRRAFGWDRLKTNRPTYTTLWLESLEDRRLLTGPSAFGHITDGQFDVINSHQEWSDLQPSFFPTSHSYLYADQATLNHPAGAHPDTFMLMYDEVGETTALTANQYFTVGFTTVEHEGTANRLNLYSVHIFTDGTITFLENGVVQSDANGNTRVQTIGGQAGKVGFGTSPNSSTPHVIAEFQIALSANQTVLNGGYSPDPQFWTSDPPPPPPPCDVPALTPITDPLAQEYENAAPNAPLHLELVDSTLLANVNQFVADAQSEMGLNLHITSAYRPPAYQAHLYEIRLRKIALNNLTPDQQQACQSLINEVNAEIQKHGLQLDPNGIPLVNPPDLSDHGHIPVEAIDLGPRTVIRGLNAQQLAQFNQLASQDGLQRPSPKDIVHFTLGNDPLALNVEAASPVRLLVQNLSSGQEIGFNSNTSDIVNDFGPEVGYYSGLMSDPQVVTIASTNPGSFLITGVGTSNGTYTITLGLLDEDSEQISTQVITGTTSFGSPIAPIQVTVNQTGDITTTMLPAPPPPPTAILPGFNSHVLSGNDDGSTGAVPLGFTANFFGTNYTSLFVNNNGNVTFDSQLSQFTPFNLNSTGHVIIAPFFADVDTRVGNVVTYGTGTVNGHAAFGVTWPGVGYFSTQTNKLDTFQLVLISRTDIGPGDFDIEFNYGQIRWETGNASGGSNGLGGSSARAGFSNGPGQAGTFLELPGSAVHGGLLDSNALTGLIHNSVGSPEPGQFVFDVRGGAPVTHATAAFLQANLDGTTTVQPTSVLIGEEPTLTEEIRRIVQFRVKAGLTNSATELTTELVQGLVDDGRIAPQQANQVIANVLGQVQQAPTFTNGSPTASITAGQAYSFQFTVGAVPAASFSVTGAPSELTINPTTGLLSTNGVLLTLATSYNLTVTAQNSLGSAQESFTLTVNPGLATSFNVSGPQAVTGGTAFRYTVKAFDAFNNFATGYSGPITFTTTDPQSRQGAAFNLTQGVGSNNVTFRTGGTWSLTASGPNPTGGTLSSTLNNIVATLQLAQTGGVVIDDGTAQRSMVRSLTVTFQGDVNPTADLFRLVNLLSPNTPIGLVFGSSTLVNGNTQLTIRFNDPSVTGTSLADGRYTFNSQLQTVSFWRLYGDVNGDSRVDNTALTAFQSAYRTRRGQANYRSYFDYDGNGSVDAVDYYQFQRRLHAKLNADGTVSPF